MLGPDLLVAPVTSPGVTELAVYLPAGQSWRVVTTGERWDGGQWATVPAPLDSVPILVRADAPDPF
jgi:alpha-D-xyloside xylohydrolase